VKALLPLLLLALASPALAAPSPEAEPAMRLEAGSTTGQQLVAIGRDISVEGEALSDVAAMNGSVDVSGRVDGSVIVLRGDARLAPTARVGGDVFVVGGRIHAARGAQTGGRMVSYPNAPNAWLTLARPRLRFPPGAGG